MTLAFVTVMLSLGEIAAAPHQSLSEVLSPRGVLMPLTFDDMVSIIANGGKSCGPYFGVKDAGSRDKVGIAFLYQGVVDGKPKSPILIKTGSNHLHTYAIASGEKPKVKVIFDGPNKVYFEIGVAPEDRAKAPCLKHALGSKPTVRT